MDTQFENLNLDLWKEDLETKQDSFAVALNEWTDRYIERYLLRSEEGIKFLKESEDELKAHTNDVLYIGQALERAVRKTERRTLRRFSDINTQKNRVVALTVSQTAQEAQLRGSETMLDDYERRQTILFWQSIRLLGLGVFVGGWLVS